MGKEGVEERGGGCTLPFAEVHAGTHKHMHHSWTVPVETVLLAYFGLGSVNRLAG